MSEQYIRPCEQDGISDDFWDHVARGSVNPGLDYVCAWGDQAWASKTGTVASISNSIGGSGGRYILIDWDDGTESYYLHLSSIEVVRGQRVAQHENVAKTGASGFGSEFGYGAHLHFTIRINGSNVDPLPLVVPPNGAGWASVGIAKTPEQLEEEEIMSVAGDILAAIAGVATAVGDVKQWVLNVFAKKQWAIIKDAGTGVIYAVAPGNVVRVPTVDHLVLGRRRGIFPEGELELPSNEADFFIAFYETSEQNENAALALLTKLSVAEVQKLNSDAGYPAA